MVCFSNSPILPNACVIEPTYIDLDEDPNLIGLRPVCSWTRWRWHSNIRVHRDMEDLDAFEPDDNVNIDERADIQHAVGVHFYQHRSHSAFSLPFSPGQDILWLGQTMTDEPDLIQSAVRRSYGSAIDNTVENVMMAERCWRDRSARRMAEILDAFRGLQSVTLILQDGDQNASGEEAKRRVMEDLQAIAPRIWRIQYINQQGLIL